MNYPAIRARDRLMSRYSALAATSHANFASELARFLNFIQSDLLLSSIVGEIEGSCQEIRDELNAYIQSHRSGFDFTADTHVENAAIGLAVIRRVIVLEDATAFWQFTPIGTSQMLNAHVRAFVEQFVTPLYQELSERIEDGNLVLHELTRAKHFIEWFRRDDFYKSYTDDTRHGEKSLAWKLYEILFQRGLDFSIEPASISGEADMVASQGSGNPLIADVKIFDPNRSKGSSYIYKGIRQVFTYANDYNQAIGYLFLFSATNKRLLLQLASDNSGGDHLSFGGKTIYVIQTDIYPHEESASHRASADEEVLTRSEVIEQLSQHGD